MKKIMRRAEARIDDTWRLSDIFEDEAHWERAFAEAREEVALLSAFAGRLAERAALTEALARYFDVQRRVEALVTYAAMLRDEDTAVAHNQALADRAETLATELNAAASFIAPELTALAPEQLAEVARDPALGEFDMYLRELERGRAHTLGAAEEKLVALAGDMSSSARTIYELLTSADMSFPSIEGPDGAPIQITQGSYVPTLMTRDRRVREDAYRAYYGVYRRFASTIPAAYAGAVKASQFYAKARGFASTREAALFADNLPISVYDSLIDAVHRHLPALNRLLERNARLIGLDRLSMWDVYVPAAQEFALDLKFDEAYDLIVDCLAPLGADYQAVLRRARDERWIDRYENTGKHPGAYAWGTYDSHPYVLLNYHENLDSLLTVAHEMGHAMHTYLSGKTQPYPKAGYSMFAAEVASTVNEVLVLLELMRRYPEREAQACLLYHLLDGYRTTLFRQAMFAEFERDAHAMAEAGEALTLDNLNALYKRLGETYLPAVEQGDDAAYEWMRIPHFYRPFYVFVYATGFSAATAIASKIRAEGESAARSYRAFLSAGSSLYPLDALKLAGIDMASPEPVERALELFEQLLERYEQVT